MKRFFVLGAAVLCLTLGGYVALGQAKEVSVSLSDAKQTTESRYRSRHYSSSRRSTNFHFSFGRSYHRPHYYSWHSWHRHPHPPPRVIVIH